MSTDAGKGQCFISTTFVPIYLTVLPDLDRDQSLSYFLHGVPEWQSGHTTCKQDGSVEWGVTSFSTVRHVHVWKPASLEYLCLLQWVCIITFVIYTSVSNAKPNSQFDCYYTKYKSCVQLVLILFVFLSWRPVCLCSWRHKRMCGRWKAVIWNVDRMSHLQSMITSVVYSECLKGVSKEWLCSSTNCFPQLSSASAAQIGIPEIKQPFQICQLWQIKDWFGIFFLQN